MIHLAGGTGHILAVAPVEAGDGARTLTHGGAHAIHRRIAAANHNHVVTLSGNFRRATSKPCTITGNQKFKRRQHPGQHCARQGLERPRAVDSGSQQYGIMFFLQFLKRDRFADFLIQVEANTATLILRDAAGDDVFIQLEVGNAVNQQPSGAVLAFVNLYRDTFASQYLRRRQPCRAAAHNPHRNPALFRRAEILHPAFFPRSLGDVFFDRPNRDGAKILIHDTITFAQLILRADAAADFGKIIGSGRKFIGVFEPPFGHEFQPIGNVVMQRAMHLTERHAALQAARGLIGRLAGGEFAVNFVHILNALRRCPCFGVGLR